jgi:hypothetical protein
MKLRRTALVSIVGLALVACGGDDSNGDTAPGSSTTTTEATTSTTADGGAAEGSGVAVGEVVRLTSGDVDVQVRVLEPLALDALAAQPEGEPAEPKEAHSVVLEYENVGTAPVALAEDLGYTPLDADGEPLVSSAADFCTSSKPNDGFDASIDPGETARIALCLNIAPGTAFTLRVQTTDSVAEGFLAVA